MNYGRDLLALVAMVALFLLGWLLIFIYGGIYP